VKDTAKTRAARANETALEIAEEKSVVNFTKQKVFHFCRVTNFKSHGVSGSGCSL
jgi:hypothetical protein